tara:strand:- start:287 stop:964 length:678 start_codon:yes stop_codon:yes gene_type:complete
MNLLARHKKILIEKAKQMPFSDSIPRLRLEDNFPSFSYLFLDSEDVFKNVVIKFEGNVVSIPPFLRSGFSVEITKDTIRILNINKLRLKDNILLKFVGTIKSINYSLINFWGGASSKGLKFEKEKDEINLNENLMSSSAVEIKDTEVSEVLGGLKKKEISVFPRTQKIIRNNLYFLYTSGEEFFLKGKNYIGDYHYIVASGKYMTGKIESLSSHVLTKRISKLRG